MKPNDDRREPARAAAPPRESRFRIERLEERIAPKRGGTTKKCVTAFCGSDSIGGSSY